jgi:site-specific DNA recombinase
MMRAAEAKAFDVIVAEGMDRIFRNQADYHSARTGNTREFCIKMTG